MKTTKLKILIQIRILNLNQNLNYLILFEKKLHSGFRKIVLKLNHKLIMFKFLKK
jgi:hypothetical protein